MYSYNILRNRRALTITEVIISSAVAMYIVLALWAVYVIGFKWWYETAPFVEAQRTARMALNTVIEGTMDTTAGQDVLSTPTSKTYKRRNGIAWAMRKKSDTYPRPYPEIADDGRRINFRLEQDSSNVRSFYLGTVSESMKAVYYVDNASVAHKIKSTEGITDLIFESVAGYDNLFKVTAKVERYAAGTKYESSPLIVEYSDFIYLRNL